MRIAVCDDEKFYREKILELLRKYEQTRQDLNFTLSAFSSAEELLNHTSEHGGFDLYILDIIMPEISGIKLGSALRASGDGGLIVYLTSSPDFAVDSYTVEAFHYLLKPINADSFFHCIDKAAARLIRLQKDVIAVKTSNSVRMLPVYNIFYAERSGRLICYHLNDGSCLNSATFNGTFRNAAAPLLAHREILPVGSSFAVNLRHVTEITRHDLIIAGKYKIAIPRGKYDAYKAEWSDYWLNGGYYNVI